MAGKRNRSDFTRLFEELAVDVKKSAIQALSEGADVVVDDAKRRVPIGPPGRRGRSPGQLRNSIHKIALRDGQRIKIVADAKNKNIPYGQYVEFWPERKHPFLYPAMDAQRDRVKEKITDAIRGAVRKNGRR